MATERRADAQRNVAAILDAAARCLSADPDASVGTIAREAGVGRVTLYGHFPNRAELVDAVFVDNLDRAERLLSTLDLTGDPGGALDRLVTSSWREVDRSRSLLAAAQRCLGPERVRELHDRPMRRVREIVDRGRDGGRFRSDLPATWMVATVYSVLHAAADETAAGRLAEPDVAAVLVTTLRAAFDVPGGASRPVETQAR